MKKYSLFLIVCFLISMSSYQVIKGQDKTKDEKDKELQETIVKQKKAIADQKKANDQEEQNLKKQQMEIEYFNKEDLDSLVNDSKDRAKIIMDFAHDRRRPFVFTETPEPPFVPDMEGFWGHGDSERTTWDFSKTVKENTFSSDYTFDVEKTAKSVVMSIMGDCKSGEIRIKIVMPNGKNYSDILIDESGNLNWRKSFQITDKDNQDKAGNWKFQISSTKATGYFRISLQTY